MLYLGRSGKVEASVNEAGYADDRCTSKVLVDTVDVFQPQLPCHAVEKRDPSRLRMRKMYTHRNWFLLYVVHVNSAAERRKRKQRQMENSAFELNGNLESWSRCLATVVFTRSSVTQSSKYAFRAKYGVSRKENSGHCIK